MADTIKIGSLDISSFKVGSDDCKVYLGDTLLYPQNQHDYSQDYLTFSAIEDVQIKFSATTSSNALYYSTDSGSTWTKLSRTSYTPVITSGAKVLFKGSGNTYYSGGDYKGIGTFIVSGGTVNVEGNAMSLLYNDNFVGEDTFTANHMGIFKFLFYNCDKLIDAKNLSLPATTMASSCYQSMFMGCTSLTAAPAELPATTMASRCYQSMFMGCTSLTAAPAELPDNTTDCMYACNSMFMGCTSLTTAPILRTQKLRYGFYQSMFKGCTSLNSITCLATDISAASCTDTWVTDVASSGTFTKASSMTSWTTGTNGIPTNWTVVDYSG